MAKHDVKAILDAERARDRVTIAHSEVYWRGVHDLLEQQLNGKERWTPYRAGTIERDAYYAGIDRGWRIFRSRPKQAA